jgi:type I restriction enzyme S subunit
MSIRQTKVEKICDLVRGSSPRPKGDPRYYGGTVPRLMIEDITRDGKYVVPKVDFLTKEGAMLSRPMKKNDLVMTVSGKTGVPAILEVDACIHDGFVGFRNLSPEVSVEYLFHYFSFYSKVTDSKSVGAIFKNLTTEQIKNIVIPLPKLNIQKQIAAILDKADGLRKKDQQLLVKYDELLQSIFYDMFGDPIKNEKKWEKVKLGVLCDLVSSGSTPLGGAKIYQKEGIMFIRSQNVLMNEFDFSDISFISDEIHNKMKRTWVKYKDVLLNITGASIGRVAVYNGKDDKANVNQHVAIIRLIKDKMAQFFLSHLIATDNFQNKYIGASQGGTREAFTFSSIKSFDVIIPPITLQRKFSTIVQNIQQQKHQVKQQMEQSESLFQSLLQRAFKGELIK